MQASVDSPAVPYFKRHPLGFWFFFWGEFAERCSYYGMRAILTLYMADQLGMGKENATLYMSFFIAGCYILPLLGGFLADNFFGKYWTIVGFSIPYILGHVILGVENVPCLIIALVLLAMGSGVIKPNISTLMGLTYDQQRPGDSQLRTEGFAMFYFAINFGAALSQYYMPLIRTSYGYAWAFLFPAALMILSFAIFAAGKRFYAIEKIERRRITPEEWEERWEVLKRIAGLFLLVTFFWAIFDQTASVWIFFAKESMDCTLFGQSVDPDQIQAFNPVFIMILLPLTTIALRWINRDGIRVRPTDKMTLGFVLAAVTMAVMWGASAIASPENKISIWWQVIAYLVLTQAEILISVTGLELAYAAAPKTMTGFVTGCWALTVGLANLGINAPLGSTLESTPMETLFMVQTLTMIGVTVAFFFVAQRFNRPVVTQVA